MSFIPYQIDYSVKNTAKTLGFSKKKVTFKFGFANQVAVDSGDSGPSCRGSEHDVTFVWSLKSGKRQLFLDGKEVHFSESGLNGWTNDRTWQYAFGMRDTTIGARNQLKVHFISQPVNRDIPDSKPFDLRIAGVSYFSFNQIYELGTPRMTVRGGARSGRPSGDDEMLSAEERRLIAKAKLESLKDLDHPNSAPPSTSMSRDEPSLIDFGAPAPPPPQPLAQQPAPVTSVGAPPSLQQQQFASAITLDTAIDDTTPSQPSPWGQPPPQQQQQQPYGGMPAYGYAAPAPYGAPQQAPSPFGAPPPGNTTALAPYQAPAGQPAPSPYAMPAAPVSAPTYGYPPQKPQYQQQQQQPYGAAQNLMSPSGQSATSFGSAPSFAQPPKQPPQTAPAYTGYPPPAQQQPAYPGYY